MEGDEDDGGDMDDFEEEFQIKSPTKQKPPHEPVNFDVYSENGEQPAQKWRPGGPALSSFTGSVAGKDLEQEREMEGGMEWKDRIDKWKTKQEKRGKLNRDDSDDDDDKNDDEYML